MSTISFTAGQYFREKMRGHDNDSRVILYGCPAEAERPECYGRGLARSLRMLLHQFKVLHISRQ